MPKKSILASKWNFIRGLIILGNVFSLQAEDGVCSKCIRIREENKKKVNPYEYYEDYLKAQEDTAKDQNKNKAANEVNSPKKSS